MSFRSRLARTTVVLAASAAFAASAGTAFANPSETGLANRADNAPGGATTHVDDHRPAGAGQGRKVG
jgi:hypothetical protein